MMRDMAAAEACNCEGKGALCVAHPDKPWNHEGCDCPRATWCMNVACEAGRENLRDAIARWKRSAATPNVAEWIRTFDEQRIAEAEAQLAAWNADQLVKGPS